jgi:uncharacterized membrane protein SpoIIM required for sporulation
MIINLPKFIAEEKAYWDALEGMLDAMNKNPQQQLNLEELKKLQYLYQRASADLAKMMTFASPPEISGRLEALVARAYGEIQESRGGAQRFRPVHWLICTLPQTFRRRVRAFYLALAITGVGMLFGAGAITLDPEAKEVIMPFPGLQIDPSQRVAEEEEVKETDELAGKKARGFAFYVVNNTRVSITTLALGVTWGVGTIILLFLNGVILGAVCLDYILAGESVFLAGWLLPHGSIEIPAILLAGQAGLVIAGAMIGWGRRLTLKNRLREISGDLVTLICGVALMLIWAAVIEAFLSQYHEPVIPYWAKISFGALQLLALIMFFALAGRRGENREGATVR